MRRRHGRRSARTLPLTGAPCWPSAVRLTPPSTIPGSSRKNRSSTAPNSCLAQAPTLQEHLNLQLHLARPESRMRKIAEHLIENIDDRGYLRYDLQEARQSCFCPAQDVEQALRLIQSFDPPGVGSRNLKECLLLQLERRGLRNVLMERLVSFLLKDPTDRNLPRIARSMGLTAEELTARCDLIRSLNPQPGSSFSRLGEPRYIIPDVVVEKVGDEFLVLVNDQSVPAAYGQPHLPGPVGRPGRLRPA